MEDFEIEFYPERNINGPFFLIYTGKESSCQQHHFGAALERKCMFFTIFYQPPLCSSISLERQGEAEETTLKPTDWTFTSNSRQFITFGYGLILGLKARPLDIRVSN